MADDAVCCEPLSNVSSSLLNRELTGNFGVFGPKISLARSKKAGSTRVFPQIPYSTEQGISKHRTGNFFGGTGNFQGRSRELIEAAFLQSSEV
jgi:hypothetical protein